MPKSKRPKLDEASHSTALTVKAKTDENDVQPKGTRYGPSSIQKISLSKGEEPVKTQPPSIPIRYGPSGTRHFASNDANFTAFTKKASIKKFEAGKLPQVYKKASYNDDVKLEHFQSSTRHFAGKQRRGVIDEHMECLSMAEHLDTALKSPFFLSLSVPLPDSIRAAALFLKDAPTEAVRTFWDQQLSALDELIQDASQTEAEWIKLIPPETAPTAGKIQLAAFMSLSLQCQAGGSTWLQQFLFGFPLVGRLSQRHCYPLKLKEALKKPEPTDKIFNTNEARFHDRSLKSGNKNAPTLWSEALEQCGKGWLTRPFPLSTTNEPFVLNNPKLNVAFRFGVEQGSKLRACDDLRHSRTNLSCIVETPIKLVSWDHLAELANLVNDRSREWSFFKADREAAYKQLPLDYRHAKLAAIVLKSPEDGRWYGFFSRTLMFGAIAAVLHYNVFSRLLSELVSKLLGIPLLCFFDDFGALIPRELAKSALDTFTAFCSKLGVKLKLEKSEYGQKVTFLGLMGFFPCRENDFQLSVTLTQEKASRWCQEIREFLKRRSISSPELEKLIGKLGFSQTNLFGKFARTQLRPLYKKFYAKNFSAKLSLSEARTLQWWAHVLSSLHPRIPRPSNCPPDLVIYTDAALLSRRLAAIIISTGQSGIKADLLAVSQTPSSWFKLFHKRNPIIGMELMAPLAILWTAQSLLMGKRINLYIDNDTASNTLIRGDCADPFLSSMIKAFWRLAEKLQLDIWVGRVGSPVNPADLPTRFKNLPFPVKRSIHFKSLFALLMEVKRW